MCEDKKESKCLCHHIKPFILADQNNKFHNKYFKPNYITELYFFLKDAYSLVDATEDERFNEKLAQLVTVYIKPSSEPQGFDSKIQTINVNEEENRVIFLTAYKKFEKNHKRVTVCAALQTLIHDVEKLVYNNRSGDELFMKLLKEEKNPKIYGRKNSSANLKKIRWGLSAKDHHPGKESTDEPTPTETSHSSTL
jgi:hypothetical protein